MHFKNLVIFVILGLASGCALEGGKINRPTPLSLGDYKSQATPEAKQAARPQSLELDAELSQDLKESVLARTMTLEQARQIEQERHTQKQLAVERALENIRKEAREEYAATRPEEIKDAILKETVCLGMSDKDVLVCAGQPLRKGQTVSKRGVRESWTYNKVTVWFENGVVSGWRSEH